MEAIIVCGPTGSGKSIFAMELAERYNGEIINADSRQIYRRLDIGTAKPTLDDRKRVKHHLIDIVDITEDFTAKRYAELANPIIDDVFESREIANYSRGLRPLSGIAYKRFVRGSREK